MAGVCKRGALFGAAMICVVILFSGCAPRFEYASVFVRVPPRHAAALAEIDRLAILDLYCEQDPRTAELLANKLYEKLAGRTCFDLIERRQVAHVTAELDFQQSGRVSASTRRRVGYLLGATHLYLGVIHRCSESAVEISFRVVEVESGRILLADTVREDHGPRPSARAGQLSVHARSHLLEQAAARLAANFVPYRQKVDYRVYGGRRFATGNEFMARGLFDEAAEAYALAGGPRDHRACYNRAAALYLSCRYRDAMEAVQQALAIKPGFAPYIGLYARIKKFNKIKPVGKDTTPPEIELTQPAVDGVGQTITVVPGQTLFEVAGRVVDDSTDSVIVRCNGERLHVDASGAFRIVLPVARERECIELKARDNAGNRAACDFYLQTQVSPGADGPQVEFVWPSATDGVCTVSGFPQQRTVATGAAAGNPDRCLKAVLRGRAYALHPVARVLCNSQEAGIVRRRNGGRIVDWQMPVSVTIGHQESFSVAVCDTRGTTGPQRSVTLQAAVGSTASGALLGLCVGVSRYNREAQSLQYAAADARSIASELRRASPGVFRRTRIEVLTDEQVSRASVLESLARMCGAVAAGDTVIVFLAGHGYCAQPSGFYYFLTADTTPETMHVRGLRWTDFEVALLELQRAGARVLLLLDTCHSGALDIAPDRPVELGSQLQNAGLVSFFASCAQGEESLEGNSFTVPGDGENGHGLFTCALVQGLRGLADSDGNGCVTLIELCDFTRETVSRASGQVQNPWCSCTGPDEAIVRSTAL